jgi:zinc/manganese transport system ATP-binding protein
LSALSFDNVTVRLGGRDILSAASFDIEDGEFVGMLGANGAGKTTLMRAALGLVPVASGRLPCSIARPRAATPLSATCRRAAAPSPGSG